MFNTFMKRFTTISMVVVCLCGLRAMGQGTSAKLRATLSAAPAAELPSTAAKLVKEAPVRAREGTTIEVVKAALALNPAAASPVIGAIARVSPEIAATAAGTAAAEQPKQAAAIARAAAAAAPSKAGKIVAAVCAVVPKEYRSIAIAVAEAVPTSSKEILRSVGAVVPDLKPYIEHDLAGYGMSLPPVAETLDQAKALSLNQPAPMTTSSMLVGSPGGGFVPLSNPPTNGVPNTTGNTPPGGHNYARP